MINTNDTAVEENETVVLQLHFVLKQLTTEIEKTLTVQSATVTLLDNDGKDYLQYLVHTFYW